MTHPPDESGLVISARSGDADAWEALYRSSYGRLRAYVVRRAGPEVGDDLVAETWIRAVRGIDGYRWTGARFDAWLFGIARRVVADHHRQAGRIRLLESRRHAEPAVDGPEDGVEEAAERASVRRRFDQLPQPDRELLELRVVAGLSADEVAEVLGRRPGAIRTAQHRALARLRTMIEADQRERV